MNDLPTSPHEGQIASSGGRVYEYRAPAWHVLNGGFPALIQFDEYTTTGWDIWYRPAGAQLVLVEAWGAGGGGNTYVNILDAWGCGGGGGEYSRRWIPATFLPSQANVYVGSGGAAGNPAGDGGESFFGAPNYKDYYVIAHGGTGAVDDMPGRGGGLVGVQPPYQNGNGPTTLGSWAGGSGGYGENGGSRPVEAGGSIMGGGGGGGGFSAESWDVSLGGRSVVGGWGGNGGYNANNGGGNGEFPGGGGGGGATGELGFGTYPGGDGADGLVRVWTFGLVTP